VLPNVVPGWMDRGDSSNWQGKFKKDATYTIVIKKWERKFEF